MVVLEFTMEISSCYGKPNASITRAEFITITNRAFDFNTTAAISYKDVKSSDWYINK